MFFPALLVLMVGSLPPGYAEAFKTGRTLGKPVYVLLTMDDCPGCITAKNLCTKELMYTGTFAIVNVDRYPVLGKKLLAGTTKVPQLMLYNKRTRLGWMGRRLIGYAAILQRIQEMKPSPSLVTTKITSGRSLNRRVVPIITAGYASSSPLLRELTQRTTRQLPQGGMDGSTEHYATHFINAEQRNIGNHTCAIYLGGEYVYFIAHDPPTTLREVAAFVPGTLRGMAYRDYLIMPQSDWNDRPLYILDEWSAYLAGAQVKTDLRKSDAVHDARQAIELMVYSFIMCRAAESRKNEWLPPAKYLIRIMAVRTSEVCEAVHTRQPTEYQNQCGVYVKRLRDAPDAEALRQYIRLVWGKDWSRQLLGI